MGNSSEYPRGLCGVALLLLRTSVGVLLLIGKPDQVPYAESLLVALLVGVVSIALAVGIATPVAGVAAALSRMALFIFVPEERSMVCVVVAVLSVVVSILGAGAYSFDGVIFGRRRIIL